MTCLAAMIGEDGVSAESDAVARLRHGDLDSLAELIPLYQNRLYRYLIRLVSDASVADDLFQETWLRAAVNISRYDPARSPDRSFDHWLFAIAHNLAIDHLRRRKPESLAESFNAGTKSAGNQLALDQLLDSERGKALASAITALPAPYREVLALRFEEDMKLDQIARVTGAPLPTVKSRLQRALQSLRRRFE